MKAPFCKKLCDKQPKCAIAQITTAVQLDDLLLSKAVRKTPILVCPVNAHDISGQTLELKEHCTDCGLCRYACEGNINQITDVLEKAVFADPSRLNVLFSSILGSSTGATVASEIKVKGNFREKRIDMVIILQKNVFLIKALTNVDKIPFYSRSYESVCLHYEEAHPEYCFHSIILLTQSKKDLAEKRGYALNTIGDILTTIKGD